MVDLVVGGQFMVDLFPVARQLSQLLLPDLLRQRTVSFESPLGPFTCHTECFGVFE